MLKIYHVLPRLYLIHIFAVIAIWLSTYYPGLDILLAIIYLYIIAREAGFKEDLKWKQAGIVVLLWQLPGLILVLLLLINPFAVFFLQIWCTPLLPLLSLIKGIVIGEKFSHYIVLLCIPLFFIAYYMVNYWYHKK